jgi:hypothetical protein
MTRAALLYLLFTAACGASTGLRERDAAPADVAPADDRPATQAVGPWERCFPGDLCTDATTCSPTIYSANGLPGRLCTRACARAAACPAMGRHSTFPVGCATATPETGEGQCFEVCESTANCGPGTQCVAVARIAFRLCLPVGTTP